MRISACFAAGHKFNVAVAERPQANRRLKVAPDLFLARIRTRLAHIAVKYGRGIFQTHGAWSGICTFASGLLTTAEHPVFSLQGV